MGHVMREMPEGEIAITLLAAGMEPVDGHPPIRNSEIFYTPRTVSSSRTAVVKTAEPEILRDLETEIERPPTQQQAPASLPPPIQLDEIDLDLPAFLRQQKERE
jgi:hypothetical protein